MELNEENRKRRDRRFREIAAILMIIALAAFLVACFGIITLSPRVVLYSFGVSAISFMLGFFMGRDDPDDPMIIDTTSGDCSSGG